MDSINTKITCPRCEGDGCDPEIWMPDRHPLWMDPDPCRECLRERLALCNELISENMKLKRKIGRIELELETENAELREQLARYNDDGEITEELCVSLNASRIVEQRVVYEIPLGVRDLSVCVIFGLLSTGPVVFLTDIHDEFTSPLHHLKTRGQLLRLVDALKQESNLERNQDENAN